MVTRRNFLGAMFATATAPAIVRSESLMKIFVPPPMKIVTSYGLTCDFDGGVLHSVYPKEMFEHNTSTEFAETMMNNNQGLIVHIDEHKELLIDLKELIRRTKERQVAVSNRLISDLIDQYNFLKV